MPFSMRSSTASFRWLTALYHELHFLWLLLPVINNNLRTTAIHHFIAHKPVLTKSWHGYAVNHQTFRGVVNI